MRMKLRAQALKDLEDYWAQGGDSMEGEALSEAFQNLNEIEKEMVRQSFLNQLNQNALPDQVFEEVYG